MMIAPKRTKKAIVPSSRIFGRPPDAGHGDRHGSDQSDHDRRLGQATRTAKRTA
jgi:hypothetical protein